LLLAREHAFTLPELLVYQALLCLLMVMAVNFFGPSLRLQSRGCQQAETLRAGHLCMDQICRDLRMSPQATVGYQGDSQVLSGRRPGGWTSDATTLLEDAAWFYDLAGARRAQLSLQASLGLGPTWKEPLSSMQCRSLLPQLRWQTLCAPAGEWQVTWTGGDPSRPHGTYTVRLAVQDLRLQQTVQPRMLR